MFVSNANAVGSHLRAVLSRVTETNLTKVALLSAVTGWIRVDAERGSTAEVRFNTSVDVPQFGPANTLGVTTLDGIAVDPTTLYGQRRALTLVNKTSITEPSMFDYGCNDSRAFTRGESGPYTPLYTRIRAAIAVVDMPTRFGYDAGDAIMLQLRQILSDEAATYDRFGHWLSQTWASCVNSSVIVNGTDGVLRYELEYTGGSEITGFNELDPLFPKPVAEDDGLSDGAIVGATVGGIFGLGLLTVAALACTGVVPLSAFVCGRKKQKKEDAGSADAPYKKTALRMRRLELGVEGPTSISVEDLSSPRDLDATSPAAAFHVDNPMRTLRSPPSTDPAADAEPAVDVQAPAAPAPIVLMGPDSMLTLAPPVETAVFNVVNPMMIRLQQQQQRVYERALGVAVRSDAASESPAANDTAAAAAATQNAAAAADPTGVDLILRSVEAASSRH